MQTFPPQHANLLLSESAKEAACTSDPFSPSVHMRLGNDICKLGKNRKRSLQMHDDTFLSCEYSASLTEEQLLLLFSVEDSIVQPKRPKTDEIPRSNFEILQYGNTIQKSNSLLVGSVETQDDYSTS